MRRVGFASLLSTIVALSAGEAWAVSAGFGDLLVSAGGLQNRVGLYDGATGALKSGNFAWDAGVNLNGAQGVAFGGIGTPVEGKLFVASSNLNQIVRYNGLTGTFESLVVASGGGGLMQPYGLVLRDGVQPSTEIFVASYGTNSIKRYLSDGTFLGDFVAPAVGGLSRPTSITFGPDGHLYAASSGNDRVLKYNGTTGAFIGTFVAAGSGGLDRPIDLRFGPDSNLYVTSSLTNSVMKFDGITGSFINTFVPSGGVADLQNPWGMTFHNGDLFVASRDTSSVKRFDGASGAFLGNFTQPMAPSAGFLTFSIVPEPATLLLLAGGALLIGRRRR